MTWLKLDDGFPEHERVDSLTSFAFRLHVTALCFCAKHLTDGVLREKDVRVLLVRAATKPRHVVELLEAGLWIPGNPDGYTVHDYLDYNPSADQVKEERRRAAERMRAARAARSHERSGELTAHVRLPHPIPSRSTKEPFLPSPPTDGTEGRIEHLTNGTLRDIA